MDLEEIYTEKTYRRVVREHNGRIVDLRYNQDASRVLESEGRNPNLVGKQRFEFIQPDLPNYDLRRSRIIRLSHVLCEHFPKDIRGLWRLLRHGYTMSFSNFKRLVSRVINSCDTSSLARSNDRTTKVSYKIPVVKPDAWTTLSSGIRVPLWTQKISFAGC
jgi:hypothetical protein